jgi:hypothetical protein
MYVAQNLRLSLLLVAHVFPRKPLEKMTVRDAEVITPQLSQLNIVVFDRPISF